MLDFNKLAKQIENVSRDSFVAQAEQQRSLVAANTAFEQAAGRSSEFVDKLADNADLVLWPLAEPLDELSYKSAVAKQSTPVTVVGVDGSQIMPSHHEVHTCYLLNMGYAVISYGSAHKPMLDTIPRLYHRPEDLYPLVNRRRLHIDELFISLERALLELQTLANLSMQMEERGLPVVAFLDGSLIPWSVEKLSPAYQDDFLKRMIAALAIFKEHRVPLLGYISSSRATDVINSLRVSICPYERSECRRNCSALNEEDFPCSKIWPVSDRRLYLARLLTGERSAVFLSGAKIARSMPRDEQICFMYINVGSEIARLEFPRWLHESTEKLQLALQTVSSQAEKGLGYPLCLAEAHHLAVIRGSDRQRFFQLMSNHMVELGLHAVRTSPKESGKRIGFV